MIATDHELSVEVNFVEPAQRKRNFFVQIVSSWTLRRRRSFGPRPHIGRTNCNLLLFTSEKTTCCLRPLSTTWEFSLTAMSLCGLTCRGRCRVVSQCYDSSAASDAQCPTLCFIRWLCRWLCHVSITAMQHSQGSLRPSFVDFSRCSMPPSDWYIYLLGLSTSHRCCGTCTGCGLRNASTSSWLCSFIDACTVWCHGISPITSSASPRFQPSSSPVVVFIATSDPMYTAVHCRRSCVSIGWKPPLEQSATRRHVSCNAHWFSEPPQDLFFPDLFPHNCRLHLVLYTVHNGLAVLYFRPL